MHVSFKILLLLAVCCYVGFSSPVPDDAETAESARIVNGFEVDLVDVPYQASLRRKILSGWGHMCGAVIITSRGILTAAHCVISYETSPSSLRVAVGTAYRLSGGKTYDVASVIVHEAYSTATLEHDIALLATAKLMSFGPTVHPISIADQFLALPTGTEALVSGFGTTSYEGPSSNVLLAAKVNIVAQETCARAYLRLATITTGMLCANASSPPRDACQGDSGGPLVAKNHLIGIVSFGEGCADSTYPGVYTRVSFYGEWIWRKVATIV
ncbi:trypsin-4-like [Anticarsia gemmatalis]|uniref:trypsin-4-like n=1 Tax=Anticarsia gemmatalis TaxID=129554 RepID=UPI003F769B7B